MITVYAGAAFVIIELINNITEPLRLPEWTPTLVIVLLAIGFPIVIIFSWIYDIHPEGGIVKTDPAEKVKAEEIPMSSNGWKIASYFAFAVIIALILLNIIPRINQINGVEIVDKSIAVLPFINDSPEETEMYFINGTMESILDNLCKIEDLRVVSRTSVEQYRNNSKPVQTIAKEMNVSYVLEGSGLKHGDNIRLTIQLVDAINDQHIWSNIYNRKSEEIFNLQSEIAYLIASEIEAIITPNEKRSIEKVPTTNLTAYDYYQRGNEHLYSWWWRGGEDSLALVLAEDLFNKALAYDSTFAEAYAGLAWVYWEKHGYWEAYRSENIRDSVLILADIALSYDDQLAEAYEVKGSIYEAIGRIDQAIEEFQKAIRFNPNYWKAYAGIGYIYLDQERFDLALEYLYQASILHRGKYLPYLFNGIALAYRYVGFEDLAKNYLLEALKLDGDTASYLMNLSYTGLYTGNYAEAIRISEDSYAVDSSNISALNILGHYHMMRGQFKESLEYYERFEDRIKASGDSAMFGPSRIAYAYWQNGMIEKAEYYFKEKVKRLNKFILERPVTSTYFNYYNLAGVYAFSGEKEKAYEHLRIFNQKQGIPIWMVIMINDDPLFNSIRDEPEFQQIVKDVEAKFQAEHERVRRWLEENDML